MIKHLVITICLVLLTQPLTAERYISLSPHLTELLFELGVGDKIVGTVAHSDFPAAAGKIQVIGNYQQLNIEAIVALQPTIIFTWADGNPELQLERLEKLGFTLFNSAPVSMTGLINEINAIGQLVDKEQQAEDLITTMKASLESIQQRYQSAQPISVFYQLWHQPMMALGSDPWLNSLLEYCGATNIFSHLSQAFPQISIESVVAKQPDMIILPESSRDVAQRELWDKWPSLKAVANDSLISINADLLHRYTGRSVLGLKQLCDAIEKHRTK